MNYYMLRHKDGGFMLQRKSGKGYTWSKPEEPAGHKMAPRMFTTRIGAEKAMAWYVRGAIDPNTLKPKPLFYNRHKKDWEIVPFNLERMIHEEAKHDFE